MRETGKTLAYGCVALLALTGLVLVLTVGLIQPSGADLAALAAFLLASGGLTILFGVGAAHFGWSRWVGSLRTRLLLSALLVGVLALLNVGFTSVLMFLSTHDLALLAGLLLFSLGMSVFVAVALSRSTGRSIRTLVEAVTRTSGGDLASRAPVDSGDEVGALAVAFNDMAERLEASFDRARDLERARKELIGSVSHDLRTPLASIRAMVESINDGVVTDQETTGKYLRSIEAEVNSLSRLIDDLFELSQIDAGVLELHVETSSVPELIEDTLDSMTVQASARGLSLRSSVEGDVSPLAMDAGRVQRVLYNLVQNAIRHTPTDGTITVSARELGPEVQVEVRDTGEGIPEAEIPRLFDSFYRPDASRSRTLGGAGLGLSIAKGIVQAHGGRLWVESAVGQGSTFGFALPKTGVLASTSS